MDNGIDKVGNVVERIISEFESRPVATSIKGIIILAVIKWAYGWLIK